MYFFQAFSFLYSILKNDIIIFFKISKMFFYGLFLIALVKNIDFIVSNGSKIGFLDKS